MRSGSRPTRQRYDVLLKIRGYGQFAAVQRSVAEAVNPSVVVSLRVTKFRAGAGDNYLCIDNLCHASPQWSDGGVFDAGGTLGFTSM